MPAACCDDPLKSCGPEPCARSSACVPCAVYLEILQRLAVNCGVRRCRVSPIDIQFAKPRPSGGGVNTRAIAEQGVAVEARIQEQYLLGIVSTRGKQPHQLTGMRLCTRPTGFDVLDRSRGAPCVVPTAQTAALRCVNVAQEHVPLTQEASDCVSWSLAVTRLQERGCWMMQLSARIVLWECTDVRVLALTSHDQ